MLKRKIIAIDEKKCNGCALCIPNCPEEAIAVSGKHIPFKDITTSIKGEKIK